MTNQEVWQMQRDHKARIEALNERDRKLHDLAHSAVNAMGFACQGAAQGSDAMEERYCNSAEAKLKEFDEVLFAIVPKSSCKF